MKQLILIFSCLFCLNVYAFLDKKSELPLFENNFRVVNYGAQDGLSQSAIRSMAQDDQGYLWLATESGLNRFDGLNFKVFKHDPDDKNSIPYQSIKSIYFDHHHKLWITSMNGLSYYDTIKGKFFTPKNLFSEDEKLNNFNMVKATGDYVWLMASTKLFLLNTVTLKILTINYLEKFTLSSDYFTADSVGNVWLLGNDGLYTFNMKDIQNDSIQKFEFMPEDLSVCEDLSFIDNVVWISCEGKMLKYFPEQKQFVRERISENKAAISFGKLTMDGERYWLASNNGVWVKNKEAKHWQNFTANPLLKNSLQTNKILGIFVDRQSLVWIGTFGAGLSMWNPNSQYIHYYLSSFQLSEFSKNINFWKADVTDIALGSNVDLWVATRGSGVYKLDKNGKILKHINTSKIKGFESNEVLGIFVDSHDRLWISTLYKDIFYKDGNENWQNFKLGKKLSKSNTVFRIFEDSEDRIFISTFEGLFLYDESTHTTRYLMDVFPEDFKKINLRISKVIEASDGYYWVASDAGVVVLDHDLNYVAWFNSKKAKLPLSHNEANDIVEDKFGNIWVATGIGVDRISFIQQQWVVQSYTNIEPLKGQTFYTIVADDKGFIWIGGNRGLYQLDPTSEEVNVIPQKYGLQGLEFNSSCGDKDALGRLYFGGINGLNIIDPDKLNISYPASSIVNSEFIVDGKKIQKINKSMPIEFYDNSKYIQLKFDVVDLANAENIELRMRIPQISKNWSPWTVDRFFNLFDLTPGIYNVELQSRVSGKTNVLNSAQISFKVKSSTTLFDYLFWIVSIVIAVIIMLLIRWQYQKWIEQKLKLINKQIKLTDEVTYYKNMNVEQKNENSQLLDELSSVFKDKDLLERQIHDLHLVDKQTGLHTRDFIKYSIDNAIRQFSTMIVGSSPDEQMGPNFIPQLQFLIIKLDGFEKLRLQGGQFLLNQIIIQIAAEMKNIGGAADELVRWNHDSFLLYARVDNEQTLDMLCEKLCCILREGEFGPSSSEQIAITCSIAALKFPFVDTEKLDVDWPKLIELTESAANWLSDTYGDGWLIISSRQKQNNRVFVDEGITNFGDVYHKGLFDIQTAINQTHNNS